MKVERWQQVDELLDAALERDPADRAAFLSEACAGDDELRREAESLLAAHERAGSFIEASPAHEVSELLADNRVHLEIGQRIGHYSVLSSLGRGGMGEVYLAQDTKLGRKVAIKMLPSSLDADRARRFQQEARTASALNHPNILTIHEIGEAAGLHFIATEYIEGKTLRRHLQDGKMSLRETLDAALQVASALAAAHQAGIVHRDVKPENIMLRPDGYVKVLDFGLAKLTERQAGVAGSQISTVDEVHTEPGLLMGTAGYMSPEQARGQAVDERTDIFSLGMVIYEMATGKRPFEGETFNHIIVAILEKEPPPLSRYCPEAPAELQRILTKALCKNRNERYQTAKDLAADLKRLKQELDSEESAGSRLAAGSHHRGTSRRWTTAMAAALVALLVLLVGLNVNRLRDRLRGTTSSDRIESIAVLPIDNFSHDPQQDYFADGMTESLITELAKIGALRVISRTSVMQYKEARKPLPEIARELKVDAVVEGSVIRVGDRIKITAQLIRAVPEQHLWAESYDRDLRDVLSLQSEVARTIAHEIKVKLTPQDLTNLASVHSINAQAYEAYLKGLYYFNQGGMKAARQERKDLYQKSFGFYEQAIKIEPNYALAYAGLARANHFLASNGFPEFFPRAKEAATKAIQLDDTLAEAHGALAYTIWHLDWDWPGAEREFTRAIELNPSYSEAHHGYALYLSAAARHEEAMAEIKRAEELDPLSLGVKLNESRIYVQARHYDEALEQSRTILDVYPNHPTARTNLSFCYLRKKLYESAIKEIKTAISLSGNDSSLAESVLALTYAETGNRAEAIKWQVKLNELSKKEPRLLVPIAITYVVLDEKEQAFAALEKAYNARAPNILSIKPYPEFDSVRSDPRFIDLLRRIGLTP